MRTLAYYGALSHCGYGHVVRLVHSCLTFVDVLFGVLGVY